MPRRDHDEDDEILDFSDWTVEDFENTEFDEMTEEQIEEWESAFEDLLDEEWGELEYLDGILDLDDSDFYEAGR